MAEAALIDMDAAAPPVKATRFQIGAVVAGNALEFYDFLTFSFFAVDIGQAFFPSKDSFGSLLASLATFWVGFLTRPIGAFVIGRMGDRVGRKPAMLLCFALMGLAIVGMAVTPGYAQIGLAAPVIVVALRLLQGFALGGQVGPSTAFLIEAASPPRRGVMISLQYLGQGLSTFSAGAIGVVLAATLAPPAFHAFGWRIALAIGALIVPTGLILRNGLAETLHGAEPQPTTAAARPAVRGLAIAFVMLSATTIITYVLNYITSYATVTLKMPANVAFAATMVRGLGVLIGAVLGGWLADRVGRRPVMVWPGALLLLLTVPSFWWLGELRTAANLFGLIFMLSVVSAVSSTAALVWITESMPKASRSTSLALTYAIAISIFGGSAQFNVAWLTHATGNPLAPAWYMTVAGAVGLIAMFAANETRP